MKRPNNRSSTSQIALYTYRWQVAHLSLDAVSGLTVGANVRDALARALTTELPDGHRVGYAISAMTEVLDLAQRCHATEVAIKHGDVLISMVQVGPAEAYSSEIVRDGRTVAVVRRAS